MGAWYKRFAEETLEGSISEDPVEMRDIFDKLLCLAALLKHGAWGKVHIPGTEMGYTDEQLVGLMKLSPELWAQGKRHHIDEGRILVRPRNLIEIINWPKYQSDYQRQKPQRQQKAKAQAAPAPKREKVDKRSSVKAGNEKLLRKVIDAEYLNKLQQKFPAVNVLAETEKAILYYSDQRRQLKSAKLALDNWMVKATEFKAINPKDKPLTERHRHDRRPAEYTKPEEL